MAIAVAQAGLRLIEITWNSHCPADLVRELTTALPDCEIGAGTVLTEIQVAEAIAAGAKFLFTPHTNPLLIQQATVSGIPMIPGALTPTEIVTAWQAGAASVKVFPIHLMGGADYLKSLRSPLGYIPLIPTGGVTIENARALLDAGAIAVGLSSDLFPKEAIAAEQWHLVTQRATSLMQQLGIS